jgi:hypothetical protein
MVLRGVALAMEPKRTWKIPKSVKPTQKKFKPPGFRAEVGKAQSQSFASRCLHEGLQ